MVPSTLFMLKPAMSPPAWVYRPRFVSALLGGSVSMTRKCRLREVTGKMDSRNRTEAFRVVDGRNWEQPRDSAA
jgi:hypothetical protein